MDDPINYVVPRFGTSAEPVVKALLFAETLTRGSTSPKDIVLLCHEKRYFAQSTAVSALQTSLGRGGVRKLLAGDRVPFGSEATLRLESLKTLRKSAAPEVALVCNADIRLLNSLFYFERVEIVIAIAFTLSRIEEWISRESATIPGTPISADGALQGNDVAIEALWALTYMVEPRNAWVGPWQREAAVEVLWSIYTRGCRPKPSEVKRWARLNGWSPDSAEQLRLLANEVAQNRAYPEELGFYWWPDTFRRLRSLADLRKTRETEEV
jgi:hypothetical protein